MVLVWTFISLMWIELSVYDINQSLSVADKSLFVLIPNYFSFFILSSLLMFQFNYTKLLVDLWVYQTHLTFRVFAPRFPSAWKVVFFPPTTSWCVFHCFFQIISQRSLAYWEPPSNGNLLTPLTYLTFSALFSPLHLFISFIFCLPPLEYVLWE